MMEIVTHPDKRLRQKSADIVFFDDFLRLFVSRLVESMYEHGGVGIAAPQVGVCRNIIVVDPSGGDDASQMLVMINPKIVDRKGSVESEEACLSVPGFKGKLIRSSEVDVEFRDVNGESKSIHAAGSLAIIVQHEIDHLLGVLFVDRAVSVSMTQRQKKISAAEKTA